ncbi:Right handed beta helix region [Pseudobutyrivibrio sp. YE44]|uniref:right-handed parallel beta-helix repeat-containing protein n=1 Tax=Pseudobutyrivibrio sp. YE44 TaxID=1520802 RepID=UPI00088ABFED|nr:right-handed parallel beta-helix repeat-containing protein [Pseudobutyrivibrio sp. YE44]SDB48487.1 Right handed beta helix region [Pseudobutyrivibrio sp. YE44]
MKDFTRMLAPGVLAASLAVTCTPAFSNIYAASSSIRVGSDAPTISDALDMADSGDTIIIPAGTYAEQISVETDGITILAEDGAVLDGSRLKPSSGDSSMVYIQASGVTVDNLEIKGLKLKKPSSSITPIGIEVDAGSRDISITNCKIHDMGCLYTKDSTEYNAHGILVAADVDEPIENISIKKCELYKLNLGNSEALALNGNVSNFAISENYIHDCDNIGIDAIGFENDSSNDLDRARNGKIFKNVVDSISSDPAVNVTYDSKCAGGIYVDGGKNIQIYDNYVTNCDIGIEIASEHKDTVTTGIKVNNNTLVNNNGWAGISFGGYDVDDTGCAKNCTFTNNTVYNTDGTAFVIQYACDSSNIITSNLFIAQNAAELYTECFGDNSAGNTVTGNTSNSRITSDSENNVVKITGVSIDDEDRTIAIGADDELFDCGSSRTVVNN